MCFHAKFVRIISGIFLFLTLSPAHPAAATPDAITTDGGRYHGPLVEGKLQGQGQLAWDNGASYEGGFDNGLFSGKGRLKRASGDSYEGDFSHGLMSGKGRLQTRDGSTYVGDFSNNYFNGQGRYALSDGYVYEGAFENGLYHGKGYMAGPGGTYRGDYRQGQQWGQGEQTYPDGRKYRGDFVRNQFHGKGRYEQPGGIVYEGDFEKGEFTGSGIYTNGNGMRHQGTFLKWRPHGQGSFTDPEGTVYEGQFVAGELSGSGRMSNKKGLQYEGEFKDWQPHGQGTLRLSNGDIYKGRFAYGNYDGQGTLTYATPRPDGRTQDSGIWRHGQLADDEEKRKAKANVETALYNQRILLNKALAELAPGDPQNINLYLLAVAGDGEQEVFHREVDFVRQQFDLGFGTQGRSLALINSRNTVDTAPMATVTSIRESLRGIAAVMNKEKDILFLYLTSHGSKDHELRLDQPHMDLPGLPAKELGKLLKESGIRWKVVVVSACYSGGFMNAVRDEHTLVITAARHDRSSFGCADENDFTYFGRAFFKESLAQSLSFQDAFRKAEGLIREWEDKDFKDNDPAEADEHSSPQMKSTPAIDRHLKRWWAQIAATRGQKKPVSSAAVNAHMTDN